MPDGHDHAVGGARRDGQARGQRRLVDDQRVIAAGGQRIGQAGEDSLSVVKHVADAAMHRFGCPYDPRAQRCGNGLMAQTDAQQGNRGRKPPHYRQRTAGFARRARPGRQENRSRAPAGDVVQFQRVVAAHDGLLAQLLQVAGEIVHEAVVVVDQQNHRNASSSPLALHQVSSYSACGLDWATTPPPTGSCHQPRPAVIVLIKILRSRAPSKPR